jgi:hypothetical protein
MKPLALRTLMIMSSTIAITQAGCQMHRAPGALLPSLAAARQDRSIADYAQQSSFPSPDDVGLASNEGTE